MVTRIVRICFTLGALILAIAATLTVAQAQSKSALEGIQSRKTLRVGWAVWFPYMYRDSRTRELTGVTKDVFDEMGRVLNVKVEYVEDSWATLVAGLQADRYDITMPLAITLPRALAVTYTEPITKIGMGLAIRKADSEKYKTWRDLDQSDKVISTVMGSNNVEFLSNFSSAKTSLVKDGPASAMAVLSNQADAWLNPRDSLRTAVKEYPQLIIVGGPAIGYQEVAFAVKQGDFLFRDWVSILVRDLKNSGKLMQMLSKYGYEESDLAR